MLQFSMASMYVSSSFSDPFRNVKMYFLNVRLEHDVDGTKRWNSAAKAEPGQSTVGVKRTTKLMPGSVFQSQIGPFFRSATSK